MPHDDIILKFYGSPYDIAPDVAHLWGTKFFYAKIKLFEH